jgi:streptogramin lyase
VLLLAVFIVAASAGNGASKPDKGVGPTSIAAGYGSVWIGMGNGDVIRLDSRSGQVQARLRGVPTSFVHGVAAAYGAVWALRGSLTRIDPRSNRAKVVRGVGSATAFALRAGARSLWIADDGSNKILRIDPARERVAARVRVPGRAWGVAAGPKDVVVLSVPGPGPVTGPDGTRILHRLDPATDRLSAPLDRADCDVGLSVGADAVWSFDSCTGVLARRDLQTLRPVIEVKTGVLSQTPLLGFGSVWLASRGGVLRIDPATLIVLARIPARSLTLAVGGGFVWALDPLQFVVRKIDPDTNRVVGRFEVATKS